LLLKNVTAVSGGARQVSIQEGVVRDCGCGCSATCKRCRSVFPAHAGGQIVARIISDTDQVKTAVSAALASLIQNSVVIIVYVVILFGLSCG